MGKPTVLFAGLVALAACKDDDRPTERTPPASAPRAKQPRARFHRPPGPEVEKFERPDRKRAPVEPGYLRLAELDLDLEAPADARVGGQSGFATVSHAGCGVAINTRIEREYGNTFAGMLLGGHDAGAAAPDPAERRVGTARLTCTSTSTEGDPACARAMCDSLRPVPGGAAEDPFPTDEPVIVQTAQGHYATDLAVSVWADGTVLFEGSYCHRLRQGRARLTPERTAALLDALVEDGWFDTEIVVSRDAAQCNSFGMTVRAAGKTHSSFYMSCGGDPPEPMGSLMKMVAVTVGPNPCG